MVSWPLFQMHSFLKLTDVTLVGMYMGCDMPLYAFSLFLPTIIKEVRLFLPSVRTRILHHVSSSLVSLILIKYFQ